MLDKIIRNYKYFITIKSVILVATITILFVFVGGMLLKAFIETPDFMFAIKDQMMANRQFQDTIGHANGYSIWFERNKLIEKDTIPFSVSIDSKHDSASVKIMGKYYQDRSSGRIVYCKQDTVYERL
ncbi:hypothetical protein [Hymenobacter cavernae]|uniref:Uncharacterized protein n=1 Tax=Hymenobacter cavernae TaxID=2044852 RepID=A0ABQ1TYZ5_9BACT|nr:hypothetical protein [Hymenobacter cavernae]GGF07298.1 hypothetical protein GCM10011383_17960 [Hymenobacter cavernae]